MDNGSKARASSCCPGVNMISLLLASYITAPSTYGNRPLSNNQVRRKSHQIVQMLKKQDPRVLRSVMYYMKWVPKLEYRREKCKKDIIKTNPDPVMDMLLNEAGIKRKRR